MAGCVSVKCPTSSLTSRSDSASSSTNWRRVGSARAVATCIIHYITVSSRTVSSTVETEVVLAALGPGSSQLLATIRPPTRGNDMAKVVCVLYEDPVDGLPTTYARDSIPTIESYPGGQTTPSPRAVDFRPGHLLGSVSGELGLRPYLESLGHDYVVTSDKDRQGSTFEREVTDAEVVISQPFWPAYLTAERIASAPNLKLAITAGIGSDHVDLAAANARNVTVAEVTYSNSISVSEHVVMMILGLVRNYIPSYQWVVKGGWNIADCAARSYDVEGMHVGTVAAGRIGLAVLRRLKPFDMQLHYYDRHRLPEAVEKELDLAWHTNVEDMVKVCDVVTINAPLHPETENLFNDKLLS